MLQQQHVLSVSVADSMMYRAGLNPACHSSTLAWLLLPGPDISHGSDIVGDCKLWCHHLCILVLHLSTNVVLYLFVYRRDDAANAVLT